MKIGLGVAAASLVAGGVFWAVGGRSQESAAPPALVAEKVPGKDYPYGEGVVYRREALFGSMAGSGDQDGPANEIELYSLQPCRMPNGDWYLFEGEVICGLYKYDAKKKRVIRLSSGLPFGKRGGTIETMRFARGGYNGEMSLGLDRSGKNPVIYDLNNSGARWLVNPETGAVEPLVSGGDPTEGSVVRGGAPDGSTYFAKGDGKLKKLSPDGKTVQDLGVTLEGPLTLPSYGGGLSVSEKAGRLYAGSRDPYSPWGVFWCWDMKTGKATGLAGPKMINGKRVAQDGGEVDKNFNCSSGPADKVSFWCTGGPCLGPDGGERFLYIPGGDESTCSRLDIEKKYVTKLVRAEPKGDRSLWTFGEGKQGRDYRFGDPYCWAGAPDWGTDGEFYIRVGAFTTQMDVYRPVRK